MGLPLSMVSKVLRCPDGIQINAEGVGLLELSTSTASQTMVVMDLAHLFSQTQAPHPVQDPFMILIQAAQAETCALTIQTMPALVDLALAEVTPLPAPLRQDPAYRFVSHIATLADMDPVQRLHIIGLGKILCLHLRRRFQLIPIQYEVEHIVISINTKTACIAPHLCAEEKNGINGELRSASSCLILS
ncbi:MAG: hypothetical protein HC818_03275 [Synechococcaceae cyanobacterium RM1_1_27]|nr:hypothetical protein [Synechococcaceae cyanobacterium RM1_1_27]